MFVTSPAQHVQFATPDTSYQQPQQELAKQAVPTSSCQDLLSSASSSITSSKIHLTRPIVDDLMYGS
jgi:uncharacterized protein involved in propanediol utilization